MTWQVGVLIISIVLLLIVQVFQVCLAWQHIGTKTALWLIINSFGLLWCGVLLGTTNN